MGRSIRYPAGSVVNGYPIAARADDTRIAWVQCQREGCDQIYKVHMSNVLHAQARRFCAAHQIEERSRRTMQREQERHIQRSIEVAEQQARSNATTMEVTGRVAGEASIMREMLDIVARRTVMDRAGMVWGGHINDGLCFGWFMVDCRERTEGNAVRWRAFCAVCGTGRIMYDAQLKRRGANRCWHCMRTKERFDVAKNAFRRASDKGIKMDQPDVLLRVAAWLADKGLNDDGCRTWTRDAAVTLDDMMRREQVRLVGADEPEPVAVTQVEDDIDPWDMPMEAWKYEVVEAIAIDMHHNKEKWALRFGAGYLARYNEVRAELAKRDAARKESKGE